MVEYVASVSREDFERFREIVGNDLNWPETFDDFEQSVREKIAKAKAHGIDIKVSVVDFDQFMTRVRRAGGVYQYGIFFEGMAATQDWDQTNDREAADELRSKVGDMIDKRR